MTLTRQPLAVALGAALAGLVLAHCECALLPAVDRCIEPKDCPRGYTCDERGSCVLASPGQDAAAPPDASTADALSRDVSFHDAPSHDVSSHDALSTDTPSFDTFEVDAALRDATGLDLALASDAAEVDVAPALDAAGPDIVLSRPDASTDAAESTAWTRRQKISFANAASSEDLIDFPVLIRLVALGTTYADADPTGRDLRFVDADGGTLLDYEIERWDLDQGAVIWVRVPEVEAASAEDHIWMYWGGPVELMPASSDGVWSNGYVGVYHLARSNGEVFDSSGNAHHGVIVGDPVRGTPQRIGNGLSLAVDDAVSLDGHAAQAPTANGTWSMWLRRRWSDASTYNHHIGGLYRNVSQHRMYFRWSGEDGTFQLRYEHDDLYRPWASELPFDQWALVSVTWQENGGMQLVLNNAYLGAVNIGALGGPADQWCFGGNYRCTDPSSSADGMLGQLDEVRWSSVARSLDWQVAQYYSQTGAFAVFGSVELGIWEL